MIRAFIMVAAMKHRPYLVNEVALPVGYWRRLQNGAGIPPDWVPPPVRVERPRSKPGDVLGWIGGTSLYSERAVEALTVASGATVRFSRFGSVVNKDYWVLANVPQADVLDECNSTVNRTLDGTIRSIDKFSFKNSELDAAPPIFALPGRADCEIFAKWSVAEVVVSRRLTGFQFRDPSRRHLGSLYLGKDVNAHPGVLP